MTTLADAADFIAEYETELPSFTGMGGYPAVVEVFAGHILIASSDENGRPDLTIICGDAAIAALDEAREYLANRKAEDPSDPITLHEAWGECLPEHCQCGDGGRR